MIKADYHVHSCFSADSDAPLEAMIEEALKRNFTRFCITDHMDLDFPPDQDLLFEFDVHEYMTTLERLSEIYKDRIKIIKGIEIGIQPYASTVEKTYRLLASHPFDFVICSTHLINRIDPYLPIYWENKSVAQALEEYFDTILQSIRMFSNYDVYGHLDYIIRYAPDKTDPGYIGYCYDAYREQIDPILRHIIEQGKGIEVNTAALKAGLDMPHPRKDILARYLELGGEIITIGSDAHKPEHYAYEFEKAKKYLEALGVKYYTVFENRKPIFEKL